MRSCYRRKAVLRNRRSRRWRGATSRDGRSTSGSMLGLHRLMRMGNHVKAVRMRLTLITKLLLELQLILMIMLTILKLMVIMVRMTTILRSDPSTSFTFRRHLYFNSNIVLLIYHTYICILKNIYRCILKVTHINKKHV